MKKLIMFIFTLITLIWVSPISVKAEAIENLKAPTLQYKLVNHDKISLKWTAVEEADKYYIYRQNPVSGKFNLRYSAVTDTTVTILFRILICKLFRSV